MKFVPQVISRGIGRQILVAKKNSPHLFFTAGIIGTVASTVMACRATLKLEKTIDEIKIDLQAIEQMKELALDDKKSYSEKEYYRDIGYVYGKNATKLVKLYGPSIILGTASIACLTGSHVQMTKRNSALMFTLSAVSKAFDEYRIRVRNELGVDRELDIHRAISVRSVENEKGKEELVKITDTNGLSPYARIFDECSLNYQKSAEMNRIFIECQQNYYNHVLHARGHVFLNEVYDALGFERSQEGAVVGWILDGEGDNYVDFGLYEAMSSRFVNGIERNIILDFNVDGVIFDKI